MKQSPVSGLWRVYLDGVAVPWIAWSGDEKIHATRYAAGLRLELADKGECQ